MAIIFNTLIIFNVGEVLRFGSLARGSRRGENQSAFLLSPSIEKCCSALIYFFGRINTPIAVVVPALRGRKKFRISGC
jgi:hypothetical protein